MRERIKLEWGWAEAEVTARPVRVGDRLVPPTIDVHFAGAAGQPTLEMTIETLPGGVPECASLRLSRAKGERPIRTIDLKAIRIAEWVTDIAAMFATHIVSERDGQIVAVMRDTEIDNLDAVRTLQEARKGRSARKLDRSFLKQVAKTYRNAKRAPTTTVAEAYGVSRAMASKYIRKCRDEGFLDEPTNRNGG